MTGTASRARECGIRLHLDKSPCICIFIYKIARHWQHCYARAPHCPQNGPWTGAPQALQKLRGGAGGGISQLRSGAAAGISSADGADGTGKPWSGPDSTVPSDAQAVAAADDVSDTTVPNTWTSVDDVSDTTSNT